MMPGIVEWAALVADPDGRQFCAVPLPESAGERHGVRAGISLAAAGDMGLARRQADPSGAAGAFPPGAAGAFPPGAAGAFPSRAGLLAALGVESSRVRSLRQVHSRRVVVVDGEPADGLAKLEADGMVTARPDLLLTVTVADCLPVFLLDRASGAFGLVHSGWKGTGIVVDALRLMAARFGTRAGEVAAAIGPGIGACCYEVPAERHGEFRARFGPHAVAEGRRLDLRRANVALLSAEGVASISVVGECTCCSPRLGSYRRQGAAGFTRMLAFIGRWPGRETT